MSVSRTPASANINIDEFERRVRAPGDQQAVEDPLVEFMRLVQSFGPPDGVFQAPDAASTPDRADPLAAKALAATQLRPSTVAGTEPLEVEGSAPLEVEDWPSDTLQPSKPVKDRWPHVSTPRAAAIAVAGAGLLIAAGFGLTATFGLTAPRLVKARASAAAADLAPAAQTSHDFVAAPTVAKAIPLKDVAKPAPAETIASAERPAEPNAAVSPGDRSETPALAPAPAGGEQQPATQAFAEPAPGAPINAPVVSAPVAAPPPPAPGTPRPALSSRLPSRTQRPARPPPSPPGARARRRRRTTRRSCGQRPPRLSRRLQLKPICRRSLCGDPPPGSPSPKRRRQRLAPPRSRAASRRFPPKHPSSSRRRRLRPRRRPQRPRRKRLLRP